MHPYPRKARAVSPRLKKRRSLTGEDILGNTAQLLE